MPDSTLKILRFGSCHFVMKDEIQNYEQIFLSFSYALCGHLERGRRNIPKKLTAWTEHCSHIIQEIVSRTKIALSQYMYILCIMCPTQHIRKLYIQLGPKVDICVNL